jgi:hypothetical protein
MVGFWHKCEDKCLDSDLLPLRLSHWAPCCGAHGKELACGVYSLQGKTESTAQLSAFFRVCQLAGKPSDPLAKIVSTAGGDFLQAAVL